MSAAGVLTMGALQGKAACREGGFTQGGVEHAADLRIAPVTAAGKDDGPARPDVHRLPPLIDIAVLPIALQKLAGLRVLPRRIVGPDPQNFTRERLADV